MTNGLTPDADLEADEDLIIRPGMERPFLIPWCCSCKDGVESFTMDPVTSHTRVGIQATCHGKTDGIWLTVEDFFARKREGKPVRMFARGAFDRVR